MSSGADPHPRPPGGRHQFVVNVRSLRQQPGSRLEVHLAGVLSDLAVTDSAVPAGAEVTFDGYLEAALGGVSVVGVVRAPWTGTCRRCLAQASGVLEAEVDEFFRDERIVEREGGTEDDDYLVGADVADLQTLVHDAVILDLPLAPLCSPECKGLCASCGANRNETTCSCEPPADPRWSALAGL